jgi:glycyl-tRNA synthetase beta chain
MPELLLELFSEEIPARMQARGAEDLRRLVVEALADEGLASGAAKAYATPRRLALVVAGVPEASPEVREERKGPRVNAPEQAVEGFLKSAGLASIAAARVVADPKRGDFYVADVVKPGRRARDIVAEAIPAVVARFPWPRSMRWGAGQTSWVRPLRSILCLLDGTVVPFAIEDVASGATTRGHRFHGNQPFRVRDAADYLEALKAHKVILDGEQRLARIRDEARALAKEHKLALVEDDALLAENAGLTEWPSVLIGEFDASFLALPAECVMLTMKQHQKCFALKKLHSGRLANRFLLVTNLLARDGGKAIVAGNEKVIRARLADARFFFEHDLQKPLDEMAAALAGMTFHEQLGTQKERVERLAELAFRVAPSVDADKEDARRAAQLAKADLVSGMVGAFPELQGVMGRTYAEAAGTKPEIARAIELHYKPKGASDGVPRASDGDAVAVAVALADKLDTLVGFWAVGAKPTGSGDPYQLRRAALGVIRVVLENDLRLDLAGAFRHAAAELAKQRPQLFDAKGRDLAQPLIDELVVFFRERLKVYLREQGARHDLIDAVVSFSGACDLALIVKRVKALERFLATEDGAVLLTGVKRATNILRDEERKDRRSWSGAADPQRLREPQEVALHRAILKVKADSAAALNVENFAGAMRALAELRGPVDAFFDRVTVNATDPALRANRLALLSEIRSATLTVADFSKIAG